MKASLAPSAHYIGTNGETYVTNRQSDPNHLGYALNFSFFRPYLKAADTVLDFGCGNGGMLAHLGEHVGRAEGLEVNPMAAQIARRSGYHVYECLEEIPQTATYDAIISNHVFEHVRDVATTLEQLRRLLKLGGLLVTKLPIDDWRNSQQQTWSATDIDHHLHTWTPRLFANVLLESGYEVQSVQIICSAWHPRLFPLVRLGLGEMAFRAFAMLKRRRQLLAVGMRKN